MQPFRLQFDSPILEKPYRTPLVFIGVGERELKLPMLGGRTEGGRSGLHVLIVRGRTRARLVALAFAAAARGTRAVNRTPHLDSFLVDRCTIEQRHSTVAVDGEVVKIDSPLEYQLGREALKLVVPDRATFRDRWCTSGARSQQRAARVQLRRPARVHEGSGNRGLSRYAG